MSFWQFFRKADYHKNRPRDLKNSCTGGTACPTIYCLRIPDFLFISFDHFVTMGWKIFWGWNQPFRLPDVEPGLTEWDTCARAGLGLLATEDPVPGVPLVPPFMVYVGGGGRLEAVSILELRTSMSAFCNKQERKIIAHHSKCTFKGLSSKPSGNYIAVPNFCFLS